MLDYSQFNILLFEFVNAPHFPTLDNINPSEKALFSIKKENYYECIQEGGNKAFIPFKRTLTDSKVTKRKVIEVVSMTVDNVLYEKVVVEK